MLDPVRTLLHGVETPYKDILSALLEKHPHFALLGSTSKAEEAVELAEAHRPALVLLDSFQLPHDGVSLCSALHTVSPDSKFAILHFELEEHFPDDLRFPLHWIPKGLRFRELADNLLTIARS